MRGMSRRSSNPQDLRARTSPFQFSTIAIGLIRARELFFLQICIPKENPSYSQISPPNARSVGVVKWKRNRVKLQRLIALKCALSVGMDQMRAQVTHQKSQAIRIRSCQMRRQKRTRTRRRRKSGHLIDLDHEHQKFSQNITSHLFYQPSLLLALISLLAPLGAVHCLRISSIEIPPAIWNGSETTLACNYELAPKDQLYSVKWYKDYVEFYRFQPPAGTDPTGAPSQPSSITTTTLASEQPGEPGGRNLNLNYQISPNSKHEFELEGINLDLSKSNATHVHLRPVSLATEAIFKCEISADSPTFATVSAERQMKVYVLPKQKLTLIEASAQQATSVQVPATVAGSSQQHANNLMQLNVYQLNDLINVTCATGAARPAAHLTWLLNDVPISSLSLLGPTGGQAALEINIIQSSPRSQIVETRSNLALRLQAHHLRQLAGTFARNRNQPHQQPGSTYLPLKLTCLARMALDFASESSILISGGKTSTSKRSRTRDGSSSEPLAESWQRGNTPTDLDQEDLVTHSSRKRLQLDPTMIQGDDDNDEERSDLTTQKPIVSAYRWPPVQGRLHGASKQQQQRQHHALAWSSVAPPIGSESNYRRTAAQSIPATTTTAVAGMRHNAVWTTKQLRAQSEHIDQLLRRSGANQLEAPQIEARTIESDSELEPHDGSAGSPSFEPDPYEATPVIAGSLPLNNYELNELVNFTCYHQGPPVEQLSVQLKWFLNERELTADFINAFDGTKFYSSSRAAGANLTSSRSLNISSTGRAATIPKGAATQRSLVIEFTPSLFQLKELSLKCKSIVEQPLIELEQSQLLYLATSPFIQAQLPNQPPPPPAPVVTNPHARPSLYQVKHRQQQQQQHGQPGGGLDQRQRANVIRMRQSSRSSSAATTNMQRSHLSLLAVTLAVLSGSLLLLIPNDLYLPI